jgi:hypothetical protein
MSEFDFAVEALLDAASKDYRRWYNDSNESDEKIEALVSEFREGFEIAPGRKYLKIIHTHYNQRYVWGFVVLKDGGKFKRGDLLKPASWAQPATNAARGNIFEDYTVRWTGPLYL